MLMSYIRHDPNTGLLVHRPIFADIYRQKFRGTVWYFNPYTGEPRTRSEIYNDVYGAKIIEPAYVERSKVELAIKTVHTTAEGDLLLTLPAFHPDIFDGTFRYGSLKIANLMNIYQRGKSLFVGIEEHPIVIKETRILGAQFMENHLPAFLLSTDPSTHLPGCTIDGLDAQANYLDQMGKMGMARLLASVDFDSDGCLTNLVNLSLIMGLPGSGNGYNPTRR